MAFPDFANYVDQEYGGWGEPGICIGCLRSSPRLAQGEENQYCEFCLRALYGDDQARHQIALAVSAAIEEILAPIKRWGS